MTSKPLCKPSRLPVRHRTESKQVEPQQAINEIWRGFLAQKVQPILSIFPFERREQFPRTSRHNELLSADYQRVVEDCRRKVDKIIGECKRVNLRFRDIDWDLDWDIKYENGYCLNSINFELFSMSKLTTVESEAAIPRAVKRVHEIFEDPVFMKNVRASDVMQGDLGNCWLMGSLTAMAGVEGGIQHTCAAYDTDIGIYGFVFYRDGQWRYCIIDDKLCLKSPCWDSPSKQRHLLEQINEEDIEGIYRKTYQTGSKALFFAQCKDQNETWVSLIEKAYAKAHGDYASLEGGWIGEGIEDLSGGVTTELLSSDILNLDAFWDNELSRVNREFLFGCSTGHLENGYGERDGIRETHAYIVMDARTLKSGQRLIKLRNPWGKNRNGLWEGPWSDGSKEWTTETQKELGHAFGNDSVFWISYEDLIRKYTLFDRTRLFQDPDWRCSQEWIMTSVPWKPRYTAIFHVSLYQESPVVMCLSQLDGRYFEGLHGQYIFQLHFRLHHKNRPDAEDYIVRSHGNYFMRRSVSVDIPKLSASCYTVYVEVTAERDRTLPSVEDVVKAECKDMEDNEKLARVGQQYDQAYSKVWGYMSQAASRQQPDKSKRCKSSQEESLRPSAQAGAIKNSSSSHRCGSNSFENSEAQVGGQTIRSALATIDEVAEPRCDERMKANSSLTQVVVEASKNANEAAASCLIDHDNSQTSTVGSAEAMANVAGGAEEDGNISDSSHEDWESSIGYAGPRPVSPQASQPTDNAGKGEEKTASPWNAACVIGLRVYSKDPSLELHAIPSDLK